MINNQTTTNFVIDLDNISKSFNSTQKPIVVLKNIKLQIEEGEFLVIFGPSGCGKSTLLHIILGLEPPDSGSSVKILKKLMYPKNSSDSSSFDEDETAEFRKEHIGMVYQQTYWIKSQNVLQNVAFPLLLLGEEIATAYQQAKEVLEAVGMSDWAEYVPTELSSGQQQKVNLARALITNPEILIADEPTGNLDFQSGQELMKMLVKLNQVGKTVVMVTHDLEYLSYATQAAEMFDGSIKGIYKGEEKNNILKNLRTKKVHLVD
jgi:putative ABC transport system ATP-binding protein